MENDPTQLVQIIFAAAGSHKWSLVLVAVLVALVWAARKIGGRLPVVGKWITSDRGGTILALVGAMAGAILAGLVAGQPLTVGLIMHGAGVGLGAIGLYTGAKRVIAPKDGNP